MANIERINCDVAGCSKEFAYRIKGFNLCAEHCFEPNEFLEWVKTVKAKIDEQEAGKEAR